MKLLMKTLAITMILSLTSLYAHGGARHDHSVPVKEETSKTLVKEVAKQEVKRLAIAKKIDSSWLFIPISKMKKVQFNATKEWVVSFENPAVEDPSKRTLYIFVSVYGNLTGANYTGK